MQAARPVGHGMGSAAQNAQDVGLKGARTVLFGYLAHRNF
jgi:hypothetical protein